MFILTCLSHTKRYFVIKGAAVLDTKHFYLLYLRIGSKNVDIILLLIERKYLE